VSTINDHTIVDPRQKDESYTKSTTHCQQRIVGDQFYTLIVSSYENGGNLGGMLTIESTTPFVISPIGVEGAGMMLQSIRGCWL